MVKKTLIIVTMKLKHWIINKLGGTVLTIEEVAMLIPGRLEKMEEEYKPCPHGRMPIGKSHGWQHCPHCLGINK